ncbi:socius, putative [Pediculus humanus corporis]|uniref:UBX domain-containing protein 11 n=1 Tax=Pediculus humanus subsp. corporis TaxID=121224 RepID=E0VI66_PEDHC|nr:socius, putative [Pediculus humanus corporis]EEB13072.1 socius, putative [Pediculus humanus corporis]
MSDGGDAFDELFSNRGRIDQDLISLITNQMFLAERELQITRNHLIDTINKLNERDLEIIQLHEKKNEKINNVENSDESSKNKTSDDYQKLITASEKLKKQVKDMEDFLNDYGLFWVGDSKDTTRKPDFDKIIKNIQRLNTVASQSKIIQTTTGAKFESPREIKIGFYSNGILLRGNDFREYSKISTNIFLQDLEDGYFPSELQNEFPEGVPFEIDDRRNENYEKSEIKFFKGNGRRLGSNFENKPASIVLLDSLNESKSHHCTPRSKSTTFNNVNRDWMDSNDVRFKIHDGKLLILKIRYGLSKMDSLMIKMYDTDKLIKLHENIEKKLSDKFINDHVLETKINQMNFELHVYGKMPFRLLDNLYKSLKECGIVENCVINMTEI